MLPANMRFFILCSMLSRKSDKTIIFSTHDLQMAISQSDKIWLILDDKLIEGAPEDLMIAGAFDHLFDSSTVMFNSEDGTFSFRSDTKGSIFIAGQGKYRHWTEKAINRAGYTVSKEKTFPFVVIPSDSESQWQLSTKNGVYKFNTIYDLISSLSEKA